MVRVAEDVQADLLHLGRRGRHGTGTHHAAAVPLVPLAATVFKGDRRPPRLGAASEERRSSASFAFVHRPLLKSFRQGRVLQRSQPIDHCRTAGCPLSSRRRPGR